MHDEEHTNHPATDDATAVHPDDGPEVRDDWPITRAELLGIQHATRRTMIFLGALAIVGVAITVASVVLTAALWIRGSGLWWGVLLVGLEFGFLSVWAWWHVRKRLRSWAILAPRIWEADGCVCPWCKEDVRARPCEPHGVGPQHRALLIERHAAPALGRSVDDSKLELAGARPPRGWLARRAGIQWWRDQMRTMHSSDAEPEERRRAWWRVTPVYLVLLLTFIATVHLLLPPQMTHGLVVVWVVCLLAPIVWRWAPIRTGIRRCRRCQHECPDLAREICVECGADLTQPHSTIHIRFDPKALAIMAPAFLIGIFCLMFGSTIFTRLAPPGFAAQVFAWTGTPMGYYMDLDLAKMTPADAQVQADLLLEEVRADPDDRRYVGGFLDDALDAGLIPESYREEAARLTATATLAVERDESGWIAVITPDFGESIMFDEPRVGVGRVSVDGVPVDGDHAWTLRAKDLDMDWRRSFEDVTAGRPEPDEPYFEPVERLSWRIPLDLPPGEHQVEARCWIVLEGAAYTCLELDYDDQGVPILPDKYRVYELILSETVAVP